MDLYEHDAKRIFSKYGIPVPAGDLVTDARQAGEIAAKLGHVAIKAQVLAGGRGKAGGILTAATPQEAVQKAERIMGMSIKGLTVKKLLVEEYKKPEKEMYIGITIDRKARSPVFIAATEGGVDIEEIAKSSPEKIFRTHINPLTGIHDYQVRSVAYLLGRADSASISDLVRKLYMIFTDHDCMLAEINPLVRTSGAFYALDAKMVIDDNSLFRQEFLQEEEEELSALAKQHGMSYVGLDGDIGCIVNGAGLAMATLDMIEQHGGRPANFMDVRAGADEEQIRTALQIVSANKNVKVIIINIFGGLTRCDEVARAIAGREIKIPLVIRLAGTHEEEGRKILSDHGISMAMSTQEVARRAVELGHTH